MNSRAGRSLWRWAGALLLVAGLWMVRTRFPTAPALDWQTVHGFELDGEECRALREERLTTELRASLDEAAPATVAQAADKFRLELELICRANGQPADCGDLPLAPDGAALVLPLYREARETASPESR